MELSEAKFSNEYDGTDFKVRVGEVDLLGQYWIPENPTFIYVFVHGLGAYITFKRDFFDVILSNNGAVFACDHLGHGRSPGPRTSCTIDECIEETQHVIEYAQEKCANLPVVLHGHSMGGLISLSTVYKDPEWALSHIKCVIAEAPWISQCPQKRIGPVTGALIHGVSWIAPNLKIKNDVKFFSDDLDPKWVQLCQDCPLYSYDITPRLVVSQRAWASKVHQSVDLWPAQLPLLFLQGKKDPLVDAIESDQYITPLSKREGVKVTYKLYEEGSHVMLKSALRPQICHEILDFIQNNCK